MADVAEKLEEQDEIAQAEEQAPSLEGQYEVDLPDDEPFVPEQLPAKEEPESEEPQAAEETQEQAAASAHDQSVLNRAAAVGISKFDAERLFTPAGLDEMVDRLERQKAPAQPDPAALAAKKAKEEFKFDFKLEDEADPEMVRVVEHMKQANENLNGRLVQLQELATKVNAQLVERERGSYAKRFDDYVATDVKDNEAMKELLGEGPFTGLDPSGAHFKNRIAIDKVIAQMNDGTVQEHDLYERAKYAVLGSSLLKTTTTTARKGIETDMRKQQSQHVARPTARKSKPPVGDEAALQYLQDWETAHGGDPSVRF